MLIASPPNGVCETQPIRNFEFFEFMCWMYTILENISANWSEMQKKKYEIWSMSRVRLYIEIARLKYSIRALFKWGLHIQGVRPEVVAQLLDDFDSGDPVSKLGI